MTWVKDVVDLAPAIAIIGGFAVQSYILLKASNKANVNAEKALIVAEETKVAAIKTEETAVKTAGVLDVVASQTDGRLTEVMTKSGELAAKLEAQTAQILELNKSLSKAEGMANPTATPSVVLEVTNPPKEREPPKPRRPQADIDREIAALQKERDEP